MRNKISVAALVIGGSVCVAGCNAAPAQGGPPDAGNLLLFPEAGPGFGGHDSGATFAIDAGLGFGRSFGDPVSAAIAPPAISGGTLLAAPTGTLVFASDPDEDRIVVVDTATATKLGEVRLQAGDEPGRLVLDGAGRLHVALRRGGAIATIDVSTPTAPAVTARRAVCGAPRGIAYDATSDSLFVACASGELVTLPSVGAITRTVMLADDLRDVVVDGPNLLITRFRSAEVLIVEADSGTVARTASMPDTITDTMTPMSAGVAWRAIPGVDGGAIVLHQRASTAEIDPNMPGAYGGGGRGGLGGPVVMTAVTPVSSAYGPPITPALTSTPLAVDVALSSTGLLLVASAGAFPNDSQQFRMFHTTEALATGGGAIIDASDFHVSLPGRITAVAFDSASAILVQTRAPAAIVIVRDGASGLGTNVLLGGADHTDTGLDLFHSNAGAGLACASCHPENGDDGHVWTFTGSGARRTIPLRGGISATAPYHWGGEFADMPRLLDDVFGRRMGGGSLEADYQAAMLHWVDQQPQLPARAVVDAAAVTRGHDLFDSPDVGCTDCHSGALGSDEATVDVGTGGLFQVPSLHGLVDRAPYLHDGRAATLTDRFGPMGGGDMHGHTSGLDAGQIADLVAYLRTL